MYTAWTSHLKDPKDKQEFEKTVQGSRRVLNRLKDILEEREKELNNSELDPNTYEEASWAYRQADINGSKRTLNSLRKLVDLDQQQYPDLGNKETK